jgi:hypothetical protein
MESLRYRMGSGRHDSGRGGTCRDEIPDGAENQEAAHFVAMTLSLSKFSNLDENTKFEIQKGEKIWQKTNKNR